MNGCGCRREKLLTLQKATLGIGDIFQQEGMELPEHEVRKEMEDAVSDFEQNDQEYDKDRLREQVEEVLKVSCNNEPILQSTALK